MKYFLTVVLLSFIFGVLAKDVENEALPKTVITRVNPLLRATAQLSVSVRKVFETSNIIDEGPVARQYSAENKVYNDMNNMTCKMSRGTKARISAKLRNAKASWTGTTKIWNTTFIVYNGAIIMTEGGATRDFYNIRIQSVPGKILSWKGEIWAYA